MSVVNVGSVVKVNGDWSVVNVREERVVARVLVVRTTSGQTSETDIRKIVSNNSHCFQKN